VFVHVGMQSSQPMEGKLFYMFSSRNFNNALIGTWIFFLPVKLKPLHCRFALEMYYYECYFSSTGFLAFTMPISWMIIMNKTKKRSIENDMKCSHTLSIKFNTLSYQWDQTDKLWQYPNITLTDSFLLHYVCKYISVFVTA
jgi:hypothetical protein